MKNSSSQNNPAPSNIHKLLLEQPGLASKIFDSIPGLFVLADRNMRIKLCSDAFLKLTGWSMEEVYDALPLDFVPESQRATVVENITKVFESGMACWETLVVTRSGEAIPFMLYGTRVEINGDVYALGMGVDISKRVEIAKQLQFSNSLLHSLLEKTLDGILVVDPSSHVLLMNSTFRTMWNIPEDIANRRDDGLMIEAVLDQVEDPDGFVKRIKEIYSNQAQTSRDNIRLRDGRTFDRYSTPLLDDDKSYLGRIWYFRDITEDIAREEEELKNRKLESIGILAGGIAHDFNNILTAVMGNINMASILCQDSDTKRFLKEAEKAAMRAKDLTYKLLTFSRGDSPVKETADIKQVVQDTVELVLSGSRIQPIFEFEKGLWMAVFDKDQIRQVIQNLVLNAKESMPTGGKVKVSCRNFSHDGESIPNLDAGLFIEIAITDEGDGIEPENMDKIFDPYFTTSSLDNFKGKGLGLSIAHAIVTKHGGTMTVKSRPGSGATFTFFVPSSGIPAAQQTETEGHEDQRSKLGKILVMDDDPMVRKLASEMLQSLGYQVSCAENGDETLKLYQDAIESGEPFNGLILDLTIPGGKGGTEILDAIRSCTPEIKAIVSSGYATDPVIVNYRDHGFDEVLLKPYRLKELAEVVRKIRE